MFILEYIANGEYEKILCPVDAFIVFTILWSLFRQGSLPGKTGLVGVFPENVLWDQDYNLQSVLS